MINSELQNKVLSLISEFSRIRKDRKQQLKLLAKIICDAKEQEVPVNVVFVCTHNSRRSQLAQLWLRIACLHYAIDGIKSYSGGTEATSFNPRMVKAIEEFGFDLKVIDHGQNPKYQLTFSQKPEDQDTYFSKKYDVQFNPQQNILAIMVCDEADQSCPTVPGATARVSLPYLDPKSYDHTRHEQSAYTEKVKEIGREILYLVKLLTEIN